MRRFLFDTTVFVHALGGDHPYRDPCRAILEQMQEGRLSGELSIELIHEFAYVRSRRGVSRQSAAESARDVARMAPVHKVASNDIERALDLWCKYERLDMRDAIFAAQAMNRGIQSIVSTDKDFDAIEGLTRVDPMDQSAVATLR